VAVRRLGGGWEAAQAKRPSAPFLRAPERQPS
jgi:hypothetical protein